MLQNHKKVEQNTMGPEKNATEIKLTNKKFIKKSPSQDTMEVSPKILKNNKEI